MTAPGGNSNRQRLNAIVTSALVVVASIGVVRLLLMTPACAGRNDFAHYYVSSRALLEGDDPYRVSLSDRYAELGFEFDERIPHATNPPPLLWLFVPLAASPPLAACWAWQIVQLAALAGMLYLTWRLMRLHLSPLAMAAIVVLVLFSNPLYWHVYHSQVQLLLGLLLVGAFAANRSERHYLAAGLVLLAGMLKLFPLVLMPWFLWNTGERLPAKLKRMATVTTLGMLVFLLSGPRLWSEFAHHGMQIVTSNAVNRTFNFGLPSLLGNLTLAWHDFAAPESTIQLARRVGILAGLALIALGYLACLLGKGDRDRQFSLLCLVMLAGSATMWGHYLVMLTFPLVVAACSISKSKSILPKATVGAATVMILMAGTGSAPQLAAWPLLNVTLHYLPLMAVLLMAAIVAHKLLATREAHLPERRPKAIFLRPNVRRP